jgi:hypothetical protein
MLNIEAYGVDDRHCLGCAEGGEVTMRARIGDHKLIDVSVQDPVEVAEQAFSKFGDEGRATLVVVG